MTAQLDRLLAEVLRVAALEVGVREQGGRNRGPRVDEYQRAVGIDPETAAGPWCAAFLFWCFAQAARNLGRPNPCPRTASCHGLWLRSPARARVEEEDVRPGCIWIANHGRGRGHAALVEAVGEGLTLVTLEGNTDPAGSREGDGVYRRTDRTADGATLGLLDLGRVPG